MQSMNMNTWNLLENFHRQQMLVRLAKATLDINTALGAPDHILHQWRTAITLRGRAMVSMWQRRKEVDVPPLVQRIADDYLNPPKGDDRPPFARAIDNYHNATVAAQWAIGCYEAEVQATGGCHAHYLDEMALAIGAQNIAYDRLRAADTFGVLDPARRGDVTLWGSRD